MGMFRDALSEGVLGKVGLVRRSGVAKARNQWTAFTSGTSNSGFDGGRSRRRLASWKPTQLTINSILASQGPLLRARCRDVMRNNPLAITGRDSFVANMIGSGIKPSSLLSDQPDLRKSMMQAWLDWTAEADAGDAMTDFYGIQSLISSALFEAGECFVRFRARRESDGLTVPLQLETLESEMCPYWLNIIAPNGNVVMNGIEFDYRNKRVAYWFFPEHPGDLALSPQYVMSTMPVRVPAEQVLHIYRCTRPGQIRGVPIVAPALVRLFFLDQYDDAELERKRIAALFAGFVTSDTPEDILPVPSDSDAETPEDDGVMLTGLEPGTLQTLLPGEDVKFSEPADVGGSYELFHYRQQLAIFAGMGVPYSVATSDNRKQSYSSSRATIIEFRRKIEQMQYNIIVHQFCRPVWKRWVADAVISGAIEIPDFLTNQLAYTRAKWIAPRYDWVDPLKDIQAEKLAVDSGFKPRSDTVEESGYDPEENDERIAADKAREKKLGLVFPVAKAAVTQPDDDPQENADAQQDLAADDAA